MLSTIRSHVSLLGAAGGAPLSTFARSSSRKPISCRELRVVRTLFHSLRTNRRHSLSEGAACLADADLLQARLERGDHLARPVEPEDEVAAALGGDEADLDA